ncbi:hypothetical protein JCM16303_000609 [Sporobolomyces ruberrimus]
MTSALPEDSHRLSSSDIPDFYAWVEVDGQAVPVYSREDSNRKVVCYIEAIEGKEFIVKWVDLRTSRPKNSYTTHVYVDGIWQRTRILDVTKVNYLEGNPQGAAWRRFEAAGKRTSHGEEQPFLFGKMSTTDDDDAACTDKQVIESVGSVRLTYRHVKNIRKATFKAGKTTEIKPIHEKDKKARSHQTTHGESRAITSLDWSNYDDIDPENKPLQVFEFHYRSRQLLQLGGHLPDSPRSSPQIRSRSSTMINDEDSEREQEITRLEERLNALKRARRGSPGASPSGSRRVKSEATSVSLGDKGVKKAKITEKGGKGKEKKVVEDSDSD